MCDSVSRSEILRGEPSITSAPPLILLQSEEECLDQKVATKETGEAEGSGAGEKGTSEADVGTDSPPVSSGLSLSASANLPSSDAWSSSVPTSSAGSAAWSVEQAISEDKNPFSELTDEHLSRLDDVLSSEEVASFLQQTNLGALNSAPGLETEPVGLTPSSSTTSQAAGLPLTDPGNLSEDALKLELFDPQTSDSALPLGQALAHHFIQDSVREYESAVMSAAVSDHAYALPTANTASTAGMPSTASTEGSTFSPRKSARIKQRMDDGKSAFESDSDFEYYLLPKRMVRREQPDQVDQSDAERTSSSPAPSSPAVGSGSGRTKQPKRRSTRIVDLENREKAEKILQENRQKEQEAKAAMQKQKEDDAAKVEEEGSKDEDESASTPAVKQGNKQVKKGLLGKGKKGKQNQNDSQQENDQSQEIIPPKPRRGRPPGKGKLAKKKSEAKSEEAGKTVNASLEEKKKKKLLKGGLAGKLQKLKSKKAKGEGEEQDDNNKGETKMKGKGKKLGAGKASKAQPVSEDSSEEDDIPLASIHKTPGGKGKEEAAVQKPKKELKRDGGQASTKTPSQVDGSGDKAANQASKVFKPPNKGASSVEKGAHPKTPDHRQRTLSASSDGKSGSKHSEKGDTPRRPFKGDLDPSSKSAEKPGDKGKGTGNASKGEEPVSAKHSTKHKHRKSEEIIIDPTVTDLFKPDGVIPTEHLKKEGDSDSAIKDITTVSGAAKQGVHNVHGKTASGPPLGRSLSVEGKKTPSKPAQGVQSSGDATSDKKVTAVHQVSLLTKEVYTSQTGTGTEHKGDVEKKLAANNSKDSSPHVFITVKAEKEEVKILPAQQKDQRKQSVEEAEKHSHVSHKEDSKSSHSHEHHKHKSSHGVKKEGPPSHVKEERKSLFEVLGKSTDVNLKSVEEHAEKHKEEPTHVKKERKDSIERKDSVEKKGHIERKESREKTEHMERKDSIEKKGHIERKESREKTEHMERKDSIEKKGHIERKESREKTEHMERKDSIEKKGHIERKESREKTEHMERKDSVEKKEHMERKESTEKKHSKAHTERRHTKDDGHDSGDLSYEDDENDSDWEPSSDASTLYCICRKPHGNRFMICCDHCGEWYHGQCVGVSKQQGQQMEEENREYICPVCTGQSPAVKPPSQSRMVKQEGTKTKHADSKKEKPGTSESKKSRNSTDDPKALKKPLSGKDKWMTQRCIASDCKRTARLGSVFCSNSCIVRHARHALKQLRLEREKTTGHKVTDMRPSEKEHVMVKERRSGQVLTAANAPTEAQLELWLQTHPSFEVVLPHSTVSDTATFYGKKDKERRSSHVSGKKEEKREGSTPSKKGEDRPEAAVKKEEETAGSKSSATDEGPDRVRLNVRKSLRDALTHRAEEADDVVMSSSEIKRLALRIEEELFKMFENTGHKYRAKFRSLLFNIKDQKNKGLFRKILTRKVRASQLVKMSTEELASKELAKWRKMENKHTLAMIEQTEKEAMKEGHHIRKKTHKGEVEVEEEDMSTLVTHVEEPKTTVETKPEEVAPSTLVDTTDQHRAHLFDLNCKICTGKMLPPTTEEPPPPKKAKVSKQGKEEAKEKKKERRKESSRKGVTIGEVKITEVKKTVQMEEEEEEVLDHSAAILASTSSPEDVSTPGSVSTPNSTSTTVSTPVSASTSASASTSQVTVRSPDSALQSGLETKHKFTPSGPMVWKGFISMQDFAKFFTSAYRVSGPTEKLGLPDTLQICGRIGPEHMWDYLGKIRQAGSRDICILRFIPGSDDEKVAYVHLYSYLNSRSRCGVVGNAPKHVKDLYIVPLASHGKIPQVLLPFDGPGLEGNRPHMLIGIVVRQKFKRPRDPSENSATSGKSSHKSDVSSAKKVRVSKDEETEAYSPTADGDEASGTEALYIPTPTGNNARAASSASSSSPSTPSSSVSQGQPTEGSGQKVSPLAAAKQTPSSEDAEPYSPGKLMEEEDGDEPYDPEDAGQFDDDNTGTATSLPVSQPLTLPSVVSTQAAMVPSSSGSMTQSNPASSSSSSSTPAIIENVMHKISASTNPEEISSLMVAVLAGAKDSEEQKRLLGILTSKVEEQKRQQAGKVGQDDTSSSDGDKVLTFPVSSTVTETSGGGDTMAVAEMVVAATSTTSESASVSSSSVSSVVAVGPVSSNVSSVVSIPSLSAAVTVGSGISSTVSSSSSTSAAICGGAGVSSTADSSKSAETASRISTLTPDTENMPLALRALMEDLKGHTQLARAVDKRTERERREREQREAAAKEEEKKEEVVQKDVKSKESESVLPGLEEPQDADFLIPGLGGGKKSDFIPGLGEVSETDKETKGGVSSEVQDACDEVTSSTDPSHKDKVKASETGSVPSSSSEDSITGDVDLRHLVGKSKDPATRVAPAVDIALDQDDRVPAHPPPLPHPTVGSGYPPPPPAPYMLPPHPAELPPPPPLDVTDIDHRLHRPPHPPPMYPRMGPAPTSFLPRPPQQPPPPGTELPEEGDVDMRKAAKRVKPRTGGGDQPLEKVPRPDPVGPSQLVPPLPPLPPQPPPPLPPLPSSSGGGDKMGSGDMERYERGERGHRYHHHHEHWQRSHEGHDFDHRRHPHHDPHYSRHHHHPSHRSHSPSPPHRYRHEGHDRDERHRRDRHFHRDRH